MSSSLSTRTRPILVCTLLVSGTVLGLAGIDLVLPAIPYLPDALGGNAGLAQFVLAAFVAGTAAGLLLFGALGARLPRALLLSGALSAYAVCSLFCTLVTDIYGLITLRFFQGVAASAPAVFAPVIIRALFDEGGATRALGVLGSVESLVPGAAPILGAWLFSMAGWQLSFHVTAVLALLLAVAVAGFGHAIPSAKSPVAQGSYRRLLRSPIYLRYALSQALVLGGLLVFVFAAPGVIVHTMNGGLKDFIIMQSVGVACFIMAANSSGFLTGRWGAECVMLSGTVIAAVGALLLLLYALFGNNNPMLPAFIFPVMNIGLGLRGPSGFLWAVIAGDGDDDRASSLTVLAITLTSAGGTALFAPFIGAGLVGLCLLVFLLQIAAVVLFMVLPGYGRTGPSESHSA